MRPLASGWMTSEFWMALAGLAGKVTILLFTLNLIHSSDPDKVVQQITEVVAAVGALFAISQTTANYIRGRSLVKAEAVKAQALGCLPGPTVIDTRAGR